MVCLSLAGVRYDGSLLRLAQDLGDRLLPAFDTPSGIPLRWVNMAKGGEEGETRATCTACAGTLLLEFGLLSQLTGESPSPLSRSLVPCSFVDLLTTAPAPAYAALRMQGTTSTSRTRTTPPCSCFRCAPNGRGCSATP